MNKQKRINSLKERFEILKDTYDPTQGNAIVLYNIVDKILFPMLELDSNVAEQMWEYLLNKYWYGCETFRYDILTEEIFRFKTSTVDLKLREILIRNENVRNKTILLNPHNSHIYFFTFLSRLFIDGDFNFVNGIMKLYFLNDHEENNIRSNKFDLLFAFIDAMTIHKLATKEHLDFLKSWIKQVENKDDVAQLEVALFEVEDMYIRESSETMPIVSLDHSEVSIPLTLDIENEKSSNKQENNEADLKECLDELHSLIGLEAVKKEIDDLINLVKVRTLRSKRGLKTPDVSLHLVFSGNPGTGKTTVARILGRIYKTLGILSGGHLIEVDRGGLVAGYVGQTALKTQEVIRKAMGGVLFIDEVYSLTSTDSDNDFGQEAVDTLLKAMEDHRDDFVVVVAGYSELMPDFINSNPGLKSRFNKYLYFQDYDGDALFKIFKSFVDRNDYKLATTAESLICEYFHVLYETRPENFGNARDVRNVFEKAISKQANRIISMSNPTDEDIITITSKDFCAAIE